MSSSTDKPASKNCGDLTHLKRNQRVSKQADIEKNPCMKEYDMSFQCLDDNAYDRDKCSKHFLNYKHCREFWRLVVQDRKSKNIQPYLPAPEDRKQVREDYKHVMPWQ